eukprot:m.27199 g.27199  ORF g.27199 m.27199 type:complete len:384 (+) comp5918_c0_seq1:300-1451(+)
MRLLNAKAKSGVELMLEVAFFYNMLMLAAFIMHPFSQEEDFFNVVDSLADGIYMYHFGFYFVTIFVQDGYRREAEARSKLFSDRMTFLGLHVVANMPFGVLGGGRLLCRIIRLGVAPIVYQTIRGIEDITLTVFKEVLWQSGIVGAVWIVCNHPDVLAFLDFEATPLMLIGGYFSLLFILCIFRSAPVEKQPDASMFEKDDDEEDDVDLDGVCKEMIKKARLLQTVMKSQPDQFLAHILSMLKHETFRPGQKLTTIGEVGHHMFFLARGTVVGSTANNMRFTLGAGTAFGEIALMRPMSKRTATLAALTKCEVFLLNQDAFDKLRSTYPALAHSVRIEVSKYLRNDSALYVTICMKNAMHNCYKVGLAFVASLYLLILIMKWT